MRRFFDISVPRNIAPDISEVEGAHVHGVDDLKEVVEANKDARARAAAEAENLLQEEQQAFEAWKDSLETVPTIKKLRMKAEAHRDVDRLGGRLSLLGRGRAVPDEAAHALLQRRADLHHWAGKMTRLLVKHLASKGCA